MEFGFGAPTRGPLATPENLSTLAQKGQELGFGIVTVSDHVVVPTNIASRYPYSETGEFPGRAGQYLEQLTSLAFLAGQTSDLRLLTSVMVLPHRAPVLTAKMLATIDVLSGGRLIVGCGMGWMREEFEALGAPPYDERGAVGDEYLRIFKELWTSDNPSFEGKYASFSDIGFEPKPIQKNPPIWIGGESPPALRRVAQLGDAWYPIGNNPRHPVGDPEQFAEYVQRIHRYAEAADRDPSEIDLAYSAGWYNDREARIIDGRRQLFTGTPEQVAGDITAFEEVGVRHMMMGFQADTLRDTLDRMERFANDVKPLTER
ncbi:MAG: LLM class F420-dependent oxidoreductase [Chloroflexi bacterium]|nr:LLM class F420-dependent oxidoreductase [Chloroflexota bacterium]